LILGSGATASGSLVAGTEILQRGAEDDHDIIESGGLHVVQYWSLYTVLSGGAEEVVSSGGLTISTTVNSGAVEIVSSGGGAGGLTVSSGGVAIISNGGSADSTLLAGGYELVESGGVESNVTISAGTVEVANGGAIASGGQVQFAGSGTLVFDGGTGFGWTVAGLGMADEIDLQNVAFVAPTSKKGNGSRLSFTEAISNQSGTLTVTDGVHSANIELLGSYIASDFAAASDGHGGTVVTLVGTTSATLAPPHK
jgi:autotransporter passenger strand-loop-strand repeat protein